MSDVLWQMEVDKVRDEFAAGEIDRGSAETRLHALGFDLDEISDMLEAAIQ